MALAGGLQYIDNLALRFSLHGLEDKFASKPSFCLSWSEPFDLDSVAGKIVNNPKRSRSFPITLPKRTPENAEKENAGKFEQKKDARTTSFRIHSSVKEPHYTPKNTTRPHSETRSAFAHTNLEEESSDEELCDIMLEQENIKINQDFTAVKQRNELLEARGFDNSCDKRKQPSRKRYLEELDTYPSGQAKRPRPRLDFDKVLLSRTKYSEEESVSKKGSYFAPIVGSDTEDNSELNFTDLC